MDDLDDLGGDLRRFEEGVDGTRAVLSSFEGELRRLRATTGETSRDVASLGRGLSRSLKSGLTEAVLEGAKLSDVLRGLGQSMVRAAYNAAVTPVTNHIGGMVAGAVSGAMPFAKGGAFTQGRVMPFATGGVATGPMTFPMRGGTGLMGEAGPEAVMPLARGADGKLGVRTQGGAAPVNVTVNVTTPDVAGFQRSRSQIAAQMSRALSRAGRNS